jgi:hypothetical protein
MAVESQVIWVEIFGRALQLIEVALLNDAVSQQVQYAFTDVPVGVLEVAD